MNSQARVPYRRTEEPDRDAYARRLLWAEAVWVAESRRRRRGRRWWGIRRRRAGNLRTEGGNSVSLGGSPVHSAPIQWMGGENGLLEVAGGRMDGGREERSGGFGGAGRGKRMERGARECRGRCSTDSTGVCGMHRAPVENIAKKIETLERFS
jgi:hypothetical protein